MADPAFPVNELDQTTGFICVQHLGLSDRDYFAAKALQGLLACPIQPQSGVDMYARDAYKLADAMLAARTPERTSIYG